MEEGTVGEDVRLIDADYITEDRVSNDPVVIAAKCAPTIDAIPVSWIEDQIAQHTSATGWTDWWADMCRRFLQEYERRLEDGKAD